LDEEKLASFNETSRKKALKALRAGKAEKMGKAGMSRKSYTRAAARIKKSVKSRLLFNDT